MNSFDADVARMSTKLVDATIELHRNVMNNFLPSAVKFHYQFNLREMTNMTQGLCRMMKEYYREPIKVRRHLKYQCSASHCVPFSLALLKYEFVDLDLLQ